VPFFELAAARFADAGDADGETASIFHLGHIAWWHENYDLMARLLQRCTELAEAGSALAASVVTLGPLVIAEVLGDSDGVITAARTSSRDHQHPEIVPITDYLEARSHLAVGDPASALPPARRAWAAATPTMRPPAEFELLSCLWALGEADEVLTRVESAVADLEEVAWLHNRAANGAQAALWCCLAGDATTAREMLARAQLVRETAGSWARALVALAEAVLAIDRGEEAEAARLLHAELQQRKLDDPSVGRAHRAWLAVSYVLDPSTRTIWDGQELRGTIAVGRLCARAIVALRERAEVDASGLRHVDVRIIRPQLPTPWLAELAIALTVDGQQRVAEALLGGRNHRGIRDTLRSWAKCREKPIATAASTLLSSRAAPPAHALRLGVLGPLSVEFDGEPRWPAQLNRKAVRDLLLVLIDQRTIARARIRALLWPDLDDDDARNNLRVTLSYLLQALQPDRSANEPSYYLEDVGDDLRFRTDADFALDVVEFEDALRRAAECEQRGAVSLALEELERATRLYRGEYLASAADAEWAHAPRERLRLRFVRTAVRAGELALAGGQVDRASELALRAIGTDPWSEPARRLLAEACLASGDRSGARRALDHCATMLKELGVTPEPATRMLARRIGYDRFD
jgi:DNA-binding SARP family transcriptional activator